MEELQQERKMSMAEAHKRNVLFWKKHQTILTGCADLSKKSGTKILVGVAVTFWFYRF
jgi:hypothetical protein